MRIGGFVKQSLIDYPGKIAAIIFTQGCNFRCGYCHNPSLVLPELLHQNKTTSVNDVLGYLRERKNWLDGVVITGGEPTIHQDLPRFILAIKQLNFSVKLDTNGSNPEVLSQLLGEQLIDYVAMDIKSELNSEAYSGASGIKMGSEHLAKIRQSVQLLIRSGIAHEFRTTVCRELVTKENICSILNALNGTQQYFIQQYHPDPQQTDNKQLFSAYQEDELLQWIESLHMKFPVFIRK